MYQTSVSFGPRGCRSRFKACLARSTRGVLAVQKDPALLFQTAHTADLSSIPTSRDHPFIIINPNTIWWRGATEAYVVGDSESD